MSRGTMHELTGLLVIDARGHALDVDGGGRWLLDLRDERTGVKFAGRRVAVSGRRAGFDLLEVETITPL